MRVVALAFLLSGCAAYQRAWDRSVEMHGRCEQLCDRWAKDVGGPLPAMRYLPKTDTCRCWSPLAPGEPQSSWKPRPVIVEFPAPQLGDTL